MSSSAFFQPGASRSPRVKDLFGAIAGRYDLINDLQSLGLHRWWKRRVVRLAQVGPGQRALDLCCGTGDLAFGLAATGCDVVGLDFSEPMLEVARARCKRGRRERSACGGRLEFIAGDALAIPFPAGSFDAVTIGYGLRNLPDFRAGLVEMQRVLCPGGRLVVLDFGKPENPLWRWLYFAYLRVVVPGFGRWFCRNAAAYAYILDSLEAYPAQRGITALLRELGFDPVRVWNLLGGAMSLHRALRQSGMASPPGVV